MWTALWGEGRTVIFIKRTPRGKAITITIRKKNGGNPKNYDLCLNTARLDYEQAADAIIGAMKK